MTARAYRLDAEQQIADDATTTRRDRMRDRMNDPRDLRRVGDRWVDLAYAPDRADVADLGDE